MGKMQHGLNVSERYVRHGFLASVRRSEFGEVFDLRDLYEYFGFADLGRGVLPPRRAVQMIVPVRSHTDTKVWTKIANTTDTRHSSVREFLTLECLVRHWSAMVVA